MRRVLLSVAVSGMLFASSLAGVSAASENHLEPGTPGEPNCKGQTMAYLAQFGGNYDEDFRGIGGISDFTGLSVKEIHEIVNAYCAGE